MVLRPELGLRRRALSPGLLAGDQSSCALQGAEECPETRHPPRLGQTTPNVKPRTDGR